MLCVMSSGCLCIVVFNETETTEIYTYLHTRSLHDALPISSDARRRSIALQWLMWQRSGLGPMHGQAHHFVRYCPTPIDYPLQRYRNEAVRLLHVLEHRLAQTEYLAEAYSIADLACWPWVGAARAMQLDFAYFPSYSA